MEVQQKMQSIRFSTSGKEAHPRPACKFFHYPQCSQRVKMKIFSTKRSSSHQHQLRGWNRFRNVRGCKHKIQHPHRLQESSLQHPPDWIHIQTNGLKYLKYIRKHLRFSKARKLQAEPRQVKNRLRRSPRNVVKHLRTQA